jgi:hypothetical protein
MEHYSMLSGPATLAATQHIDLMFILYQRDDCHLCDLALGLLAEVRAPEFESVFVDGDEALEQRYGLRVPVRRDEDRGAELEWPFDEETLLDFLRP